MQAIHSKDTKIEISLRRELWSRGVHYRKNYRSLPGCPDIVFIRKKIAVFCDSEFWHGYDWSNKKDSINSNRDFWIPKIERNIERDRIVDRQLEALGFLVIRFWGSEIQADVSGCADIIICKLRER